MALFKRVKLCNKVYNAWEIKSANRKPLRLTVFEGKGDIFACEGGWGCEEVEVKTGYQPGAEEDSRRTKAGTPFQSFLLQECSRQNAAIIF